MIPVLVLNAGSSSLKYQLLDLADGAGERVCASGLVERIGEDEGRLVHRAAGAEPLTESGKIPDHAVALDRVLAAFERTGGLTEAPFAVGHRVVHGGDRFSGPTVVDDDVLEEIRELVPLAPLHNPANIAGIEVARARYPDTPQVAVFDTAFHAAMPPRAWRYALPRDLADRLRIRRYGFHGTSHGYVARTAAAHLRRPLDELALVTLHLGNGCSAAAVAGGRSIDTSMGLTPLGGLVMGTRSGDLDPGIVAHLHREGGLDLDAIDTLLNKESGMKGLAGLERPARGARPRRRRGRRRGRGAGGVLLPDPVHGRRLRGGAGPAGRAGVHRGDRGERRRRPRAGVRGPGRARRGGGRGAQHRGLPRDPDDLRGRQRAWRCWWCRRTRSWRSPSRRSRWSGRPPER